MLFRLPIRSMCPLSSRQAHKLAREQRRNCPLKPDLPAGPLQFQTTSTSPLRLNPPRFLAIQALCIRRCFASVSIPLRTLGRTFPTYSPILYKFRRPVDPIPPPPSPTSLMSRSTSFSGAASAVGTPLPSRPASPSSTSTLWPLFDRRKKGREPVLTIRSCPSLLPLAPSPAAPTRSTLSPCLPPRSHSYQRSVRSRPVQAEGASFIGYVFFRSFAICPQGSLQNDLDVTFAHALFLFLFRLLDVYVVPWTSEPPRLVSSCSTSLLTS
jgi:hypothetical protein